MIRRAMLYLAYFAAYVAAIYFAADYGATRVQEATALNCARASSGTDQAIADCFINAGLPVPEDL